MNECCFCRFYTNDEDEYQAHMWTHRNDLRPNPKHNEEVQCAGCKVLVHPEEAEYIEAKDLRAVDHWLCRRCASE